MQEVTQGADKHFISESEYYYAVKSEKQSSSPLLSLSPNLPASNHNQSSREQEIFMIAGIKRQC